MYDVRKETREVFILNGSEVQRETLEELRDDLNSILSDGRSIIKCNSSQTSFDGEIVTVGVAHNMELHPEHWLEFPVDTFKSMVRRATRDYGVELENE